MAFVYNRAAGARDMGRPTTVRPFGAMLPAIPARLLCITLFSTIGAACVCGAPARAFAQNAPDNDSAKLTTQPVPSMEADAPASMLESGFRNLYELDFQSGRDKFIEYQKTHPEDPMGKAAEAASYLFEQLNEKGVLTSNFFLNDSKFLNGIDGDPSQNRNPKFLEANEQAREMAKQRLQANPRDPQGLLVLTMTDGMEADYDAIIERKHIASLSLIKQAEAEANIALSSDPNAQDAYVALGVGNYIIGSLPGFKRAFLWMGGIHGDRQRGLEQLQSAADNGHYLRPFAKILLALASEREHQRDKARTLLTDLSLQFPSNPLFAKELALLQQRPAGKH
jgi:hypothetical protein